MDVFKSKEKKKYISRNGEEDRFKYLERSHTGGAAASTVRVYWHQKMYATNVQGRTPSEGYCDH
jgi:hypothetical protein